MSNMAALQNALARTQVRADAIRLIGGLDEITPPYQRKPGTARISQNFEADIHGGYRMNAAYERYDGRAKPSAAIYSIISLTITGTIAAANTITGVTSGATATVCAVVTTSSPDYLVVTKISGTFQSGEVLNVSGSPQGTASSVAVANGASTPILHAQYNNMAADVYRALIGAIPGSGKVLGIVEHGDVLYGSATRLAGRRRPSTSLPGLAGPRWLLAGRFPSPAAGHTRFWKATRSPGRLPGPRQSSLGWCSPAAPGRQGPRPGS